MPRDRLRARNISTRLIWGGLLLCIGLYVLAFMGEYLRSLAFFIRWLKAQVGGPMPEFNAAISRDLQITIITFVLGFVFVFIIWLWLTSSQAILPVENITETFKTFVHQLLFILGRHGQAVFVREGKIHSSAEELNKPRPGVVVVDFNSAVVIERMMGPPTIILLRPLGDLIRRIEDKLRVTKKSTVPQVHMRGIVFTEAFERIRGVIDLRKQSRERPDVNAYTRDGIEVTSRIFTVFSIAQEPDVIQLGYCGEACEANLRVVRIEQMKEGRVKVEILDEEIHPDDLREMDTFARFVNRFKNSSRYTPLQDSFTEPVEDTARIFAAVFAQARNPAEEKPLPWSELPASVAVDLFRETLQEFNYDYLYQLDNNTTDIIPLAEVRHAFRMRMRNLGVLSYRILVPRSGYLKNGFFSTGELFCSPVRPLTTPHLLRERGIKIITSGFSNPVPSDEVYRQRLEAWRAHWQREREIITATRDLEAIRIRNRARSLAQRELTFALGKIFEQNDITDEVLALRVMQALESAATDPKTNKLVPSDTFRLMEQIQKMFTDGGGSTKPAASVGSTPATPTPAPNAPDPVQPAPSATTGTEPPAPVQGETDAGSDATPPASPEGGANG